MLSLICAIFDSQRCSFARRPGYSIPPRLFGISLARLPNHPLMLTCHRGLVGPARQFSSGGTYSALPYLLVFGALLPIPFWLLGRRYPNSWIKYVNIPVMIGGATYMPPATGINYSSWFVVGFIFRSSSSALYIISSPSND